MTSGWVHLETRGNLADASLEHRTITGAWDGSDASIADFRLLLADLATRASSCTAEPQGTVLPDFLNARYHSRELRTITGALLRSVALLGGGGELAGQPIGTIDGKPGQVLDTANIDAALDHLAGQAVIAILGPMGLPLAFAYAAQNAPSIMRDIVSRGSAYEELLIWSRHLVETVDLHQLREKSAGHLFGYDPGERQTIDRVLEVQGRFAKLLKLPRLIPGADALSFLKPPSPDDAPILGNQLALLAGAAAFGALGLGAAVIGWKLFWR